MWPKWFLSVSTMFEGFWICSDTCWSYKPFTIFSAMFGIGHVSVYIQFVQSFKIHIDFLNNNSFCFMNQPKCFSTNGLTRSRPWYTHGFRTTVRMFQQISSTIVETNHHASKICKYKIIAEAFEQLLEQCRKRAPCFRFPDSLLHLQGLFFPGSPFSVPGPVSGTWNLFVGSRAS